jgi:hypothetical protein
MTMNLPEMVAAEESSPPPWRDRGNEPNNDNEEDKDKKEGEGVRLMARGQQQMPLKLLPDGQYTAAEGKKGQRIAKNNRGRRGRQQR